MVKEEIYIEKRFDDFSKCTDYYYEELGKLSQVPELGRFERKKIKKTIMSSMFASFKVLKKEEKQLNEMAQTMDKELYDDFKSSREVKPNFLHKFKQLLKKDRKIEVLEHNEVGLLENKNVSCEESQEISKSDSVLETNDQSAQSENADGKALCAASHDDELMSF